MSNRLIHISSSTNTLVKHIQKLVKSKKYRYENKQFVVEGFKAVQQLIAQNSQQYYIDHICFDEAIAGDDRSIAVIESNDHLKLSSFSTNVFKRLSDVESSQGILAIVEMQFPNADLPQEGRFVLLDSVMDPGNVGTLIRSALGSGFDGVFLFGSTADLFNPKVIRSTMGAFAELPVRYIENDFLENAKLQGYDIIATVLDGSESLYDMSFSSKLILAIGNESHGISDSIREISTKRVRIPMDDRCESLNAGVAGSICMFHISNVGE